MYWRNKMNIRAPEPVTVRAQQSDTAKADDADRFSFRKHSLQAKVTTLPGFSGTVPIFNDVSREKSQFFRDVHLSRFWLGVPDLARFAPPLQPCVYASVAKH